jgi:mlo protein
MEHIITELALEVAQKHSAIEGDLIVAPSDQFFWFHQPKLVLLLIHIILFQNAFEIAFFFWLLVSKDNKHICMYCSVIIRRSTGSNIKIDSQYIII